MNKRIFLVALIALFISLSANAQLFWKVSGNGLTKPSYLFGTHHLIDKEQIKNFDKILAICTQSDAVVGEMDMSDVTGMQMKMMQGGMLQGVTCKELMSPEDYTLADNEFTALMGVGMAQLGAMKPMMLNTIYSMTVYFKANNLTKQPDAVDIIFQKTAKGNNKKVIGLETVEQEMDALFNSLPLKRQAEVLIKDMKEKQKGIEILKKLNECYLAGDLAKIEALDKEDDSMTPEEKKPMIENRNNNWLKQLPSLMTAQSCFIAVGCQHLVGEVGLIKQLKKAGYIVEPVVL